MRWTALECSRPKNVRSRSRFLAMVQSRSIARRKPRGSVHHPDRNPQEEQESPYRPSLAARLEAVALAGSSNGSGNRVEVTAQEGFMISLNNKTICFIF
ncbi:hypothetical protein MUK42_27115 [Musa troglodytarum]|uniref:Uncharacterized protein n=1 Tax=Musa troglodytarum TaxID=320322 RepID=A0A9E7JUG8_9LILI|nr:hypothetical protein MUK42_27115 [Musa troglodytarum]